MRVALFLFAAMSLSPACGAEPGEFFEAKIRPLLISRCYPCHSATPSAGLRVDSRAALLKGGKSGPSIVPGNAPQSLLIQAVAHTHARIKMPPTGTLDPQDVANLDQWVRDGAIWPESPPAAESAQYALRPDQKAFWSFQAVQKRTPPIADEPEWNRNPIDQFVYAKLKEKGLTPGSKADRATLLRRVSFDLTGLPPTREEIAAFVNDSSPDAFEKRIDHLMATQQYGERWGRHWLDVVRYADTAGDAADFPVPEMYKYRNYVIDAFTNDKPYDRFLREQLAGDLLPAADEAQHWEQTVATGYITVSRRVGVSPKNDRHVTLEDTIGNFGQTMLGLSVGCARCHDHKFDPIPTADYYALYGIFDSTTYPFSGEEHNPYRGDFVYRVGKEKAAEILKPFDDAFAPWKKLERDKFSEYQEFQDKKILTPGRSREVVWSELTKVRQDLVPFAEAYPALETAWAVSEGKPHDVKIQIYGEPKNTSALVRRGFPLILGGMKVPETEKGSGRLQLAQWLTDPANPLTARVIVNRIWHYHFGKGIVATTSDFGVRGTLPTHPELLDYLAARFMEDGWSFKKMHKLILMSETYRLSSADIAANAAIDPGNNYLWRQNRQRLDAEEISDSLRFLSGTLDLSMGGRQPFPNDRTYFFRQHEPFGAVYPNARRAVYGMQQRIQKNPYLDLFDGSDGNLPLPERRSTTTSLQALYLMNSEFLDKQSQLIANRLANPEIAFETIFGRPAKASELEQSKQFLATFEKEYRAAGDSQPGAKAWASYIHAMLGSNPFLFVE